MRIRSAFDTIWDHMARTVDRRPIVGVMGSGTEPHVEKAQAVGRLLAELGVHLLTGGGGGVMASVSQAFAEHPQRQGSVLAVLPALPGDPLCPAPPGYPNPWVEIPIHTHLPLLGERGAEPLSRNHINVLASNVIIVLPGSAGTTAEGALALLYKRPIVAYLQREEMPNLPKGIPATSDLEVLRRFVAGHL